MGRTLARAMFALAVSMPPGPALHAAGFDAALRAALANNPAVLGKSFEVDARFQSISAARSARLPSVFLDAETLGDDSATIGLEQSLFTFGKIANGIARETRAWEAERWDLLRVQRQLIEDTATAYATVIGLREKLAIADDNVHAHEQLHEQTRRRRQGQMASDVDLRLAFSRLNQAQSERAALRSEVQSAELALAALTIEDVSVDAAIVPERLALPSLAELEAGFVSGNAELARDSARIDVATLDLVGQRRSRWPDISLRVEHDLAGTQDAVDATRAGIRVSGRLGGLGSTASAGIRAADARLAAARAQLDLSRIELGQRLRNLARERDLQAELQRADERAVAALGDTLDSFERLHDSGRKSFLDVLNTLREYSAQRLSLVQSRTDYLRSTLRIAALSGLYDEAAGITVPAVPGMPAR